MDSPILEDVSSDALVAERPKTIVVKGVRYVLESEFLNTKASLDLAEAKLKETKTASQLDQASVSEQAVFKADQLRNEIATQLSASNAVATANPGIRPPSKVNPFGSRDPIVAASDAGTAPAMFDDSGFFAGFRPKTIGEALVAAVHATTARSTAPPMTANASTCKKTIISKWANPDPASQPTEPPVSKPTVSITSIRSVGNPSVLQPRSVNGAAREASPNRTTKTMDAAKSPSTPKPIAPTSKPGSTSPIFGDRKAFGRFSVYAARPPEYEPLPFKPAPPRKLHAPGPGFKQLIEELSNMNGDEAAVNTPSANVAPQPLAQGQQTEGDESDESEL